MSVKGFSVNGAVEQYDYNALANKPTTTGLSDEAKQALLACFENVAWINDQGQSYVDALETALYPPANLVSISAVYTQSGTVYDTDTLDSLKADLVVTATYDNGTTAAVTAYTLSGTLTAGTSTITVSYGGKITTFDVTVSESYLAYWDFTQSLFDTTNRYAFALSNENGTLERTSNGILFSKGTTDFTAYATTGSIKFPLGTTVTIEFGQMEANFSGNSGSSGSVYRLPNGQVLSSPFGIYWRGTSDKFSIWQGTGWHDDWYESVPPNFFSNKTAIIKMNAIGGATLEVDGQTIATAPTGTFTSDYSISFGRSSGGQTYSIMYIKKVAIKSGV